MNPLNDNNYVGPSVSGTYCVGNGLTAAYIKNADITQLFGPCYSMPSMFSMICQEQDLIFRSVRRRQAVIWRVGISDTEGGSVGCITDFCEPERPVFLRRFSLKREIKFRISVPFEHQWDAFSDGPVRSFLIRVPAGSSVFGLNYTDRELYGRVIFPAGALIEDDTVTVPAGESSFIFASGDNESPARPSFITCMEESIRAGNEDPDEAYEKCVEYWEKRFSEIRQLPESVKEAAEDTAAALFSQTSVQGGILAGSFYHLGYGRDMYGGIRGYLALGLYEQAKRCVDFFVGQYRSKKGIPNAGGMGMSCSHCHENDDCEQTGYYLLELTDIIDACGDADFVGKRSDYVRYLLEAQEKRLWRGMLPFNGDETYIAGSILPRSCIDHGSMEATALYITGAERILDAAEKHGFLENGYIKARRAAVENAKKLFAGNFTADDGSIYANSPERLIGAPMAGYRHGICLGCGRMEYCALTAEKTYLCSGCFGKKTVYPDTERHFVDCAPLMIGYIGSDVLPPEIIAASARNAYTDRIEKQKGRNTVGYEFGLWLYVLCVYGNEKDKTLLPEIAAEVERLRKADGGSGVWVEYYHNGKASPSCCPYRPWESAINMCGLIKYAEMTS